MTHSKHFQTIKFTIEREIGRRTLHGMRDSLSSTLYSNFRSYRHFDSCGDQGQDWGGIFGFGFSPDGKILAAACENKCVLLYDPGNAKLVKKRYKTHNDCVNCVRFLDDRLFATCSDDNTVRLWDSRFLKEELRTLRGHTNWVKNIEYSSTHGKLITSGFDGNILAWDINNYAEESEHLLFIKETMRTKMTQDESKLIVSTFRGFFLLIHNLDLNHLKEDLQRFRRHSNRYLQMMGFPPQNYIINTRKRNQVEIICDFPDNDQAESISALQIHPHGWCVVSRNTTADEESEWTCVHDIQPRPVDQIRNGSSSVSSISDTSSVEESTEPSSLSANHHAINDLVSRSDVSPVNSEQRESASSFADQANGNDRNSTEMIETEVNAESQLEDVRNSNRPPQRRFQRDLLSNLADIVSFIETSSFSDLPSPLQNSDLIGVQGGAVLQRLLLTLPERILRQEENRQNLLQHQQQDASRLHQFGFKRADPRLLYFTEEPNVGRGFIKEQSFSPDGRIIASPYGNHVRLLAFDQGCTEICDNVPREPMSLHEVANCALLNSSILTSTFSPVDCMFVAGARDGSVAFSQPVL